MILRRFYTALAAALLVSLSGGAGASVMAEVEVPQLARDADLVARGKVASTESRRSRDGKRIYTVVTLQVGETWKGAPAETVQIQVPGGAVDGIAQIVQGAPRFTEGEEVVVFLRGGPKSPDLPALPLRVVAMAQGKLRIDRNAAGVEVAVPDLTGLELLREGAAVPVPAPKLEPIPVIELQQQVKAAAR